MSSYLSAKERYKKHRRIARELLEEEALHAFRTRVDVIAIDDDILRKARRDWYESPSRLVDWDWEGQVVAPGRRSSARYFDFAIVVSGKLCALAAARVSHKKRWLSLTHVEGAPGEHSLKGRVLALVINALYIYRGVICSKETVQSLGIRVLNPLPEALTCYKAHGYTLSNDSKRLSSIEIEPSIALGADHGSAPEDSPVATTEDAGNSGG